MNVRMLNQNLFFFTTQANFLSELDDDKLALVFDELLPESLEDVDRLPQINQKNLGLSLMNHRLHIIPKNISNNGIWGSLGPDNFSRIIALKVDCDGRKVSPLQINQMHNSILLKRDRLLIIRNAPSLDKKSELFHMKKRSAFKFLSQLST
jgi:hypothetical protein